MSPQYAERTPVSADKSRAEIESLLARYGADQFMYGWDDDRAVVAFRMEGKHVRFLLPMPDRDSDEFTLTPSRRTRRHPEDARKQWEQATRSRWRSLALVIKAKLEAVEAGITIFQDEFLAHIVLPDGSTVGQWAGPQLERAYTTGAMPSSLLALPSAGETS